MKITYTPNPLETIIELNDQEKELLRLKIKLEKYEDRIFEAHFYLTKRLADNDLIDVLPKETAIDEAVKLLDPGYWCDDLEGRENYSRLDRRVDELLDHYIEELKSTHIGDCTAYPMSCSKCLAENMLGISSLDPYPGKHALHEINRAFNYRDGTEWKQRSYEQVLEIVGQTAKDYLIQHQAKRSGGL
jgi:hypothetical protein